MSKKWLIAFVLLVSAGAFAEQMTATVTSYNSVSVAGDVGERTEVTFESTTHSGNRIGAGGIATMTWAGLPKGTIDKISVWMHSNQKSGGAMVRIVSDNQIDTLADGAFRDWPGMDGFSTVSKEMVWTPDGEKDTRDGITLEIGGISNSVYLDKMEVTYTPIPAVPHTVTLIWYMVEGIQKQQITEIAVADGVELPAKTDTIEKEGLWYWAGWVEQPMTETTDEPQRWEGGDRFFPDEDIVLYGVYRDCAPTQCEQDTSFQSGEYAMMYKPVAECPTFLSGGWDGGTLQTACGDVVKNAANRYEWLTDTVDNVMRYTITFDGDSVTIQNVGSHAWIGYNKSSGSNKKCRWAWKREAEGSLYLYSQKEYKTTVLENYWECMSLVPQDFLANTMLFKYGRDKWVENYTYWLLFPTADMPEHLNCRWVAWQETTDQFSPKKTVTTDGLQRVGDKILIRKGNQLYDLQGRTWR